MTPESEERRTDPELREFIDGIEEHPFGIITQLGYHKLKEHLRRAIVGGLVAISIVALTSTAALVGYGILLTKQGNITTEIQQQRFDSVYNTCLDQNHRHDKVVKRIDDAVAAVPPPPAKQKEAQENAKPFKLILEAAVPYTDDCYAYAKKRVEGQGVK